MVISSEFNKRPIALLFYLFVIYCSEDYNNLSIEKCETKDPYIQYNLEEITQ